MAKKSIFGDIRHGLDKAGNKLKQGVEHAGHELEHGLDKAGDDIKHGLDKAGHDLEHKFNKAGHNIEDALSDINPAKAIQEIINEIKKDVLHAVHSVEGEVKGIEHKVEKAAHEVEHKFSQLEKDVEKNVKRLPNQIRKQFNHILEEIEQGLSKKGLQIAREIVHVAVEFFKSVDKENELVLAQLDKISFPLELGPIVLHYERFHIRAQNVLELLDEMIRKPPKLTRHAIIACVDTLAPTTVEFRGNVSGAAIFIQSDILKIGGGLRNIDIELVEHLLDKMLKKLGVPA